MSNAPVGYEAHRVTFGDLSRDDLREGRLLRLLRQHAAEQGIVGYGGGWLGRKYEEPRRRHGRTVTHSSLYQGWYSYFYAERRSFLDWLTWKLTASRTFEDLVKADGHYRPTILIHGPKDWQYELLADAYDTAQAKRGDPRRAHRGSKGMLLRYEKDWVKTLTSESDQITHIRTGLDRLNTYTFCRTHIPFWIPTRELRLADVTCQTCIDHYLNEKERPTPGLRRAT